MPPPIPPGFAVGPEPVPVPAVRGAYGHFLPGVSGNPNGRPNGRSIAQGQLKKLCREFTSEIIENTLSIMRNVNEPGSTRIQAMQMLLDRGYGKAVQQVETGGPGAFESLQDDELWGWLKTKVPRIIDGTLAGSEGE